MAARHKKAAHKNLFWTYERIASEAKKYKYRTGFMKGSRSAYHAAHRRGLLNEVCTHMGFKQRPNGYWTKPRVLEEAKKYRRREEFHKGSSGAYTVARQKKWLDEACAHMQKVGSRYRRAIYAFEFDDKSAYIGLTFDYDVRLREHLVHNKTVGQKARMHSYKFVRFDEWLGLEQAAKRESEIVEHYRTNGWKILNRNKVGGLGSYPRKWTKQSCIEAAKQFKTLNFR